MDLIKRKAETGREKKDIEKKDIDKVRRHAGKGLLIFFVFMLIFTVISRGTAALTMAQVTTEQPDGKKIRHTVTASGLVEKNRELAVLTQPGILVKSVYPDIGEQAAAGDLLAELDMESLEQRISDIGDEIQILKLQNETAQNTVTTAQENQRKNLERAQEDYDQAVSDQEEAVAKAAESLSDAHSALNSFFDYYAQNYHKVDETESEGNRKAQLDSILTERKAALLAAEDAYDAAVKNQHSIVTAAERALEDAKEPAAEGYDLEINAINIASKEKILEKLKELKQAEGKIVAPVDGIITGAALTTGQKTTDTAAFTMADISSGLRYKAVIGKDDALKISLGDAVTLESGAKKAADLKVDAIEFLEDGSMEVTVLLSAGDFKIGDGATLFWNQETETYPMTVPLTALHEELGKSYVLVLVSEETVLGEQYFAGKVFVAVLDKNAEYAAISSEELTAQSGIITDSDRYVEAGSRVRLQEQ